MKNKYKIKSRKKIKVIVVSDSNKKTRVVESERKFRHPFYDKVMKEKKKFYAHDEKEISKKGDIVIIEESRPTSKLKRWRVMEVQNKI